MTSLLGLLLSCPQPCGIMFAMRIRIAIVLVCLFVASALFAQDWKQVHKKDEEKWAKETGLDPFTIHKLWRMASNVPDEKDDESRIFSLDLDGLAERHELLFVTYAGEDNCLFITVFRRISETKFEKVWSVEQPPDRTAFCDTSFGTAEALAENGVITVRVPDSIADNGVKYEVYTYEWNGITYRLAGQKMRKPGD